MELLDKIKDVLIADEADLQDKAFAEAHDNPTTDHELLTFFDTGEFIYDPNAIVKSPEEWEAEVWDSGREV